jgi:hypothetical protein
MVASPGKPEASEAHPSKFITDEFATITKKGRGLHIERRGVH